MDRESERGEIRGYTERQRGLENPGPLNLRLLFFLYSTHSEFKTK